METVSVQNGGMKRAWVEFRPNATPGYIGSHRWWSGEIGHRGWRSLPPGDWDPPVRPVPGKGYPRIFVELDGFVFEFISTIEMLEAASVLERNLVDPVTSQQRWYRKLPAPMKAKHARSRAAAAIRRASAAYESQLASLSRMPSPIPKRSGAGPISRADLRL